MTIAQAAHRCGVSRAAIEYRVRHEQIQSCVVTAATTSGLRPLRLCLLSDSTQVEAVRIYDAPAAPRGWEWITTAVYAARAGVSDQAVRDWVANGRIPNSSVAWARSGLKRKPTRVFMVESVQGAETSSAPAAPDQKSPPRRRQELQQRPKFLAVGSVAERATTGVLDDAGLEDDERPRLRSECPEGPCPFVGCRYHLGSDERQHPLAGRVPYIQERWEEIEEPCTLKFVEAHPGGATLEEVGIALGVTRERIRQLETRALASLQARVAELGVSVEVLHS